MEEQAPGSDETTEAEPTSTTAEATTAGAGVLAKADLGKRFVAVIIDAVIATVLGFVPLIGGLIAAAYWLFRDGLEFEFMDYRSVGKKLMKLRPVKVDGSQIELMDSVKRNWMFALGGVVQLLLFIPILGWILMFPVGLAALVLGIIELVLVITDSDGRRFGDKMAETQVIEVAE